MIAPTILLYRIPVAFFSMKHFRCRQKHVVTPHTFRDIISKYLDPQDRLLRQSRAGSGSTRVLVLDNLQQVKGVYHPLLCLPHPSTVKGGDQALGLPVGDYLEACAPQTTGGASPEVRGEPPAVFILVSHPHGVALTSFTTDGLMRMPLVNLSSDPLSAPPSSFSSSSSSSAADPSTSLSSSTAAPTPTFMKRFAEVIEENYARYLAKCSTYYFVAKDGNSSIALRDLKDGGKVLGEGSGLGMGPFSKMLSQDARWITLPDTILQNSQKSLLYIHDHAIKKKVVSPSGLSAAVAFGSLELDVPIRRPGEAIAQTSTAA